MKMRRFGACCIVGAAAVVAACADDDGTATTAVTSTATEPTSTGTASTTSTSTTTSSTAPDDQTVVVELERDVAPIEEPNGVYRTDLVFVADPDVARVVSVDGDPLTRRLAADELRRQVPLLNDVEDRAAVEQAVSEVIGVHEVVADVDPLGVSVALRQQEVSSSPVHVVGLAGHWQYFPGSDAVALTSPDNTPALASIGAPDPDGTTVAVIDTGVVETDVSGGGVGASTLTGVEPLAAVDFEDPNLPARLKGHGSFIGSLVRQADPSLSVLVASLDTASGPLRGHEVRRVPRRAVTDELQLLVAVIRMADHLIANQIDTAALNLSLGTVGSTGGQNPENVDVNRLAWGVRTAIDYWNEAPWPGGEAPPVVAAAGNHAEDAALEPEAPFLPAAYPDVHAVVATEADGTPAAFTFTGWPGDPTVVSAPGVDLVGARGFDQSLSPAAEPMWAWGGTSFATALVAAATASTGTPQDYDLANVTQDTVDVDSGTITVTFVSP